MTQELIKLNLNKDVVATIVSSLCRAIDFVSDDKKGDIVAALVSVQAAIGHKGVEKSLHSIGFQRVGGGLDALELQRNEMKQKVAKLKNSRKSADIQMKSLQRFTNLILKNGRE